jgi:hypothetical protein
MDTRRGRQQVRQTLLVACGQVWAILLAGGWSLAESIDLLLLGMGMANGQLGLVGSEARDDVVDRLGATLAGRYEWRSFGVFLLPAIAAHHPAEGDER